MEKQYLKSLQAIKYFKRNLLRKRLTKKQYDKLAQKYNLLSHTSLQYISKCSFNILVKRIV